MLVLFRGTEHDHAVAQRKLGVSDGSVLALMNCVTGEANHLAEPVDGGGCVVIAERGDNSAC